MGKLMNAKRRKKLSEIQVALDAANADLRELMEEEQEAFDNLPDSLQNGERGEKMSSAIETMDGALNTLDQLGDEIGELADA